MKTIRSQPDVLSTGGAREQVAIHQSGRPTPVGQAAQCAVGRVPVQAANQTAAAEEWLSELQRYHTRMTDVMTSTVALIKE